MALQYTRKKDETTEKDVPAEEFIKKMVDNQRIPDSRPQVYNTESKE